ncbi:X-Pro dipeptidyl-peptidase C-terminal non-catalytic domain-containing protein [Xylariales sp. PMI_506]|nr:X-Pro dipeptidyl-peptidase C-terminal non-catalytic domain-containing protein [Xylariales sp. PMI_506]
MAPTTEQQIRTKFPDLKFSKLPSVTEAPFFQYQGFEPGTTILPHGHVKSPGRREFPVDVIFERDVTVPLRDGVKIYTDVFRPVDSDAVRVPALIPWSPYGKTGTVLAKVDRTSAYEKFEGPDPAEWCGRGYAIINVDPRGVGMSQGNMFWFGIHRINFASRLKHPALKALAPMEAFNDPYRDFVARGGKPYHVGFFNVIMSGLVGPGFVEDMPGMLKRRPLFDNYWESKYIDTANIDVPLYITASYSSGLHIAGSSNTFRTAKTEHKWLRVHPHQEWYDLYRPDVTDELQRFFDRFVKGNDNGWERDIPPVRLSLIGFDGSLAKTITERPEQEYPLARQKLVTYYLDAATNSLRHESHHLTASTDFTLYIDKHTEIAGYSKVILWMSCAEKDDMDVVVQLRKIDKSGKLLEHLNYPCPVPCEEVSNTNVAKILGTEGHLRASHAVSIDESRARGNGQEVFYAHDRREPIAPGAVTRLEMTLWPIGIVFEKGEGLMLRISGHEMAYPEFENLKLSEPEDENVGFHVVHTGGQYESTLVIPVI